MRAELLDTRTIMSDSFHNAFTSLCRWRGKVWLAYRSASNHGIVPPGVIDILREQPGTQFYRMQTLALPEGDLRDPRFIPTPDMLYLMVGCYLPSPHLRHIYTLDGLTNHPSDNQIWTMLTYTRDGITWAPLTPILRPNHWGWSAVQSGEYFLLASYDVGVFETANTITLWGGRLPGPFENLGIIYDGGSHERDGETYVYARAMPSEPVLYIPTPDTRACLARTESTMILGTWRAGKSWRWQDTGEMLHASALLQTPHGWLMAARELTPVYKHSWGRGGSDRGMQKSEKEEIARYAASVTLWHVIGNRLEKVATLAEDAQDCAYCGVCEGEKPGEYLVSYYSSKHAPGNCADVMVATVRVEA